MAKTRKRQPKVACPDCGSEGDQRCVTENGRIRSQPHASRLKAQKSARRNARLEADRLGYATGLLPRQFQAGPTPVTVKTDLLHLGIYSPEEITQAREHEARLNDGGVELTYLTNVKLLDENFQVTVMLDGARFVMPDTVARQVRQDMDILEFLAKADQDKEDSHGSDQDPGLRPLRRRRGVAKGA